ncbi:MAG TPA: hypothetical protein VMC09_02895 [Anaerolineales bacterium]|nr:hypothetical protein [Anaerolineales bacterium]
MSEKHSGFLGTYFNQSAVLMVSRASQVLAWVVLVYYAAQLILSIGTTILQVGQGFWAGIGFTDAIQNIFYIFQQPLHGVVYFLALLGISQLLLIFLDIEDNTRRTARQG